MIWFGFAGLVLVSPDWWEVVDFLEAGLLGGEHWHFGLGAWTGETEVETRGRWALPADPPPEALGGSDLRLSP